MFEQQKVRVGCRRTKSANYQSNAIDFELDLTLTAQRLAEAGVSSGAYIKEAFDLCSAVVDNRLGLKTGRRKTELDKWARRYLGCDWSDLAEGVSEGDRVL
jgi:hypothetical protein